MRERTSNVGTINLYTLSCVFAGLSFVAIWVSISSVSIILLSFSSLLLAIIDLSMMKIENESAFRELPKWIRKVFKGTKRERVPIYIGIATLLLLASLPFALFGKRQTTFVSSASDFLLMFTMAVIIFTYAVRNNLRDVSPSVEIESSKLPFDAALKVVIDNEYQTVQEINRIIIKLQDYDRIVNGIGRVHNGWSLFHDSLESFYVTDVGTLYIVKHLFWEFADEVGHASAIFGTLSNPDSCRKIGTVSMWGTVYDVHSFAILPRHTGFEEAYQHISRALSKWDKLKRNVERLHTYHSVS